MSDKTGKGPLCRHGQTLAGQRIGEKKMFFKKKEKRLFFDRNSQVPVIRSSICTGEKTAGFKDRDTGKFVDICCIRSNKDLEEFMKTYGILREEIRTEY